MEREAIFEAWAPAGALWSPWVKPVLFAHLPRALPAAEHESTFDLTWVPRATEGTTIVVDLNGSQSVFLGLVLATCGYRPVPLFNACPAPENTDPAVAAEYSMVIDVLPILAALVNGAERLRNTTLRDDAPPAFLLDARRQMPERPVLVGAFDNRSMVFATDFPSADFLRSHGIGRALLVRERPSVTDPDLRYPLQLWQRGGIELQQKWLSVAGLPEAMLLPRPWWLSGLWQRLKGALSFRHNPRGGFGDFVPAGG